MNHTRLYAWPYQNEITIYADTVFQQAQSTHSPHTKSSRVHSQRRTPGEILQPFPKQKI